MVDRRVHRHLQQVAPGLAVTRQTRVDPTQLQIQILHDIGGGAGIVESAGNDVLDLRAQLHEHAEQRRAGAGCPAVVVVACILHERFKKSLPLMAVSCRRRRCPRATLPDADLRPVDVKFYRQYEIERSEERRGGKEGGSTGRYRWGASHYKKKKKK